MVRQTPNALANQNESNSTPPPPSISDPVHEEEEEEEDLGGAEEDRRAFLDDDGEQEEEVEDGEDLINDNMEADYRDQPELDFYDAEQIDDQSYDDLDETERRKVEKKLRKRDELRGFGGIRMPGALAAESDEDSDADSQRDRRKRQRQADDADEDLGQDGFLFGEGRRDIPDINIEDPKGPLREWVMRADVASSIKKKYREFLTSSVDFKGNSIYGKKIDDMAAHNKASLEVSYLHLSRRNAILAVWVADIPKQMLRLFDEETMDIVLAMYPKYNTEIARNIHVRLTDLPVVDLLRQLRKIHLNALIRVKGIVTRRSSVFPRLAIAFYDCQVCSHLNGPIITNSVDETPINGCVNCNAKGKNMFLLRDSETIYSNYQTVRIQETPDSVPAGHLPRTKEIILQHDLIDSCRPGEEIDVTGVYTNEYEAGLNNNNGFPVFSTRIEANYIKKKDDASHCEDITEEEEQIIRQLAENPNIGEKIVQSIAPSIYGHDDIKLGIALSMFGGQRKDVNGKHRIRGDINVLLLGDPGTAKSQFLKYVEKTAPRAVLTTGQSATAVGLTASVHKDPITKEWCLEGGALVIADTGVCCIDEFDKMNDQDRTSIHEAMEQQSISISKAGIVTSLQARCAIVAAANPVKGRYDPAESFAKNVNLTEPILSRFDILCVVRDTVDPIGDERLADFVVNSHRRSHPSAPTISAENDEKRRDILSQDMLKKYIKFARANCKPKLDNIDENKISQLYSELRRESSATGGMPIAVRHIESLIRMSEAHARMHLRDHVRDDDIDLAIRVLVTSFVSTQKLQVSRAMERSFSKYITYKRDNNALLSYILNSLYKDEIQLSRYNYSNVNSDEIRVEKEEFEQRAKQVGLYDLSAFYNSLMFQSNGFSVSGRHIIKPLV